MSGPPFVHEHWLVMVLDRAAFRPTRTEEIATEVLDAAEAQLGIDAVRAWLPTAERSDDDDDVRAAARRALVSGELRLFDHGQAYEPMRGPEVQDLVDLIESTEEDSPRPPWLEVTCLGPKGETYAFNRCRVQLPDGSERYAQLDHRSRLRLDDVPKDGQCRFELADNATPDGGRMSLPAKAVVYELGTPASVSTSAAHVLRVSTARAWVEFEVVDSRGRPVPHFRGTLRTSDGVRNITLDERGFVRVEPLPDVMPVSITLTTEPTS